jgi:hypothetical protein
MPRTQLKPAEQVDPPESRRARALRGLGSAWKSTGPAIAVVGAALALAFSAWPSLRPDPRELLAATMQVVKVEPAVRYDGYLQRIHAARPHVDPQLLCATGSVVYLRVRVEGRKHGGLSLYQWLYRVSDGRRLEDQPEALARDSDFKPDTPNDQWIQPVFVPDSGHRAFARLELFDGPIMLAVADTPRLPEMSVLKESAACP